MNNMEKETELIEAINGLTYELKRFSDSMPYFRMHMSRIEAVQEAKKESKDRKQMFLKEIRKYDAENEA